MIARLVGTPARALGAALLGAGSLAGAAVLLLPSASDLTSAALRATAGLGHAAPRTAAPAPPNRSPARLAALFHAGQPLTLPELRWLLATGARNEDAATLLAVARQIEPHEAVPTARVAWDVLAGGRPAVARAFLEQRPDAGDPALWQLRVDLARRTGDLAAARAMVDAAARHPGTAPPAQLVSAALATDLPEAVVLAAEHGAVPAPDARLSLDLVHRALAAGRGDLVARIDRSGSPAWREADPWLAMDLARRAHDYSAALHYAALLPSGRDEARRAIVLASGDRPAIRAMLLEMAGAGGDRPVLAQQLVEAGFRADGIALLQAEAATRPASDPIAARLLYLMGPRPDASGLQWLRNRAASGADWRQAYLEREQPGTALAWLTAQGDAATTPMLLARLRLAAAARDRAAGTALVAQLLDGRRLAPADLAALAAHAPPRLDPRLTLALAHARITAGTASAQDWRDLAWDASQHGRFGEAGALLGTWLARAPDDRAALRLMADVTRKTGGERAARPWLERAAALSAPDSLERAELLEQLGRPAEALAIVDRLRQAAPADRHLTAMAGRLLIAGGDPGRARRLLAAAEPAR
ncbi:hypothetical protein ACFOD9_10230 [Novosphingobium bradum]|uniref:Tetratricopeptide repeat protein n=1 Tax=Novosphingobium bradum TaxID=1737444 RepID=A0ABV7ISR6_9SPHN